MTRNNVQASNDNKTTDHHALDGKEVFQTHYDQVYRVGLSLSGSPADAEDIAQEAFLAILRGLRSFRGEAALTTWIYRITLRTGTRWLSRRGTTAAPLDNETSDNQALPLDLMNALARLPISSRMVIALVSIEGLSHNEAAQVLGIPEGTVSSRLHHARSRLSALLEE